MSLETIWKKLLKEVITNGHDHKKDDSSICEIIGVHEFIPNQFVQTPIYLPPEEFLNGIKNGAYNIAGYPMSGEALYDYVSSLDNREMIYNENPDGSKKFTYTYPNRIFNMTDEHSDFMVNQFELMIRRLTGLEYDEKNDELYYHGGSNRAVANIYSAPRDCAMNDIPCLQWIQALIRDNELTLTIIFRSNDCYGAWPSNMLLINYLGLKLVDRLRKTYPQLTFKGIYYNVSSLHIYETDMSAAKKVVGL